MNSKSRAVVLLSFVAIAAVPASAQFPPLSSYRLLDTGAQPSPAVCSCISDPFKVPEFVPAGYASGPAATLESHALSRLMREMVARAFADDRASVQAMATAGLDGSANDSFGMAMHLGLYELLSRTRNAELEEQTSRWLHLAAQQEHHDAFVRLAYRYRHGLGVPKDDGAAAYWTYQGAVRGDSLAMIAAGLAYASGGGVPQDWTVAVQWWTRAAPRHPLATRFIGDAYVCGLGVERNYDRAVEAYVDAAKRGEMSARIRLGNLYAAGCAGSEDEAMKAYRSAADSGYPDAQVALSDLLREGRGTSPDPYTAYLFAKMAERRLPDGDLKTSAAERARAAAGFLSKMLIADADKMVDAMLIASR